jgi:hypothetical protein
MDKNKFTEDDKKKVIDFLNTVAENGKFEFNTNAAIQYVRLLSFMQQVLIPKIESNVLEIKQVIEPQKPKRGRKKA